MDTYLIVIFDKKISTIFYQELPTNEFSFGGKTFIDVSIGNALGFYDWLRTKKGLVIGVRMDFFSGEFISLRNELLKIPYVKHSSEGEAIDIFFTTNKKVDLEKSEDQDFLDNKIYKSVDGIYAISFDARYAIESLKHNKQIMLIDSNQNPNS